ncbi:CPBP family intramembrane glutamic endopeptidase [Amycolatopsis pigmentata]|uniref:CPBP family intramembrane glutamic endopeptidase n=1 Tax=Amycolatopsis pigmentata TaxID=450801 RepID=A0ABW5FZ80_9PSEU
MTQQASVVSRTVERPNFVSRHRMTSFFALAFGLSWLAWAPYVLCENGLGILHFKFPTVAGSSQLFGVLPGAYLGPILSAFLVTALAEGKPGLRQWAGRLLRWRVHWGWYVLVLVSVPAVLIITSIPFGGGAGAMHLPPASVFAAYLPALVFQLLTTGLAEEPGWRDFALPHLQPRFGPLRGTLILGPLWGAWHLPLFLTDWAGWPDVNWVMVIEFVASATAFSVVMTWVFNRTGESLPLAMLLHTSVNNFFSVAWVAIFPAIDFHHDTTHVLLIASTAVAVVLIAATRGRLGYKPPSVEAVG